MSARAKFYDWLRRNTGPGMRRWFKERNWFMPVVQVLFSTDVYSSSYYQDVERIEESSVIEIAKWVKAYLNPATLIDVGCGPGHMMEAFHLQGIKVFGVDISESALNRVAERKLQAIKFDLTEADAVLPGVPYDLAVSCEVAEHLQEEYVIPFVKKLSAASDTIYITAAEPDQAIGPGMMHFNEQPNSYWIELFKQEGFIYDKALSEDARRAFTSNGVISYLARPMIYRKDK
jgi:trans-aconitate methyltransferase